MISGRYRSCWLRRHWTGESGAYQVPACGALPGDVAYLLSTECPALQASLAHTYQCIQGMLAPHPLLLPPLRTALSGDRESVTRFMLDPSTDPMVITLVQLHGRDLLRPLFQVLVYGASVNENGGQHLIKLTINLSENDTQ